MRKELEPGSLLGVPDTARKILQLGGGAIAIWGTAAAAFFGVGSGTGSKRDASSQMLHEWLTTRIPVTGNQPARRTPTASVPLVEPKTPSQNHEPLNKSQTDSAVGTDLWQRPETEPIAV